MSKMKERWAELEQAAKDATPGPWRMTGSMTKYIEASIGNGWIQEVCSVGPTVADNGYGPQQEANAKLIAAANPAAILELLEVTKRLAEALKKERTVRLLGQEPDIHWESMRDMRRACYAETDAALAKYEGVQSE